MKTWTETEETTTQLFDQFEGVIYHVMKKLNIQKNNSEYDDFLQEGRLLLLAVSYTHLTLPTKLEV